MFTGVRKTRCRKARRMLSEYIDNQLGAEDRSAVERHLEICEACLNELESLQMTVQLLRRMPSVKEPRSFAVSEMEPGQREVPAPRSWGWLRTAPVFAVSRVGTGWAIICDPKRLSWLRPATALATAALVLLLMLDFLQVVPQQGEIDSREVFNGSSAQVMMSPAPEEEGDTGEIKVEESVGSPPAPAPVPTDNAPAEEVDSDEFAVGDAYDGGRDVSAEPEGGWPLHQIEMGIGAVVFILVAVTAVAWMRRRRLREV